jgi:hypothetical protein
MSPHTYTAAMSKRALAGWLLFTFSGVLFFAVGLREDDWLTMAASVVWTLGCAMFLTESAGSSGDRTS